ncbi:adenylosuccinate lyase family protein [Streptomyces sp. TS71-3]|uniref:class-II fumarase/aspartase family protein n=1 Tax=Streptomyces sp. TS71-3 TaxID=2733862 RepID=UPI001B2A499D|nr:adenylosuccinate lyase family protein [Streptomyces sp. TS71-3]GHJ40785.1 adenylosuccinate lyase [Streptomyces sp. TS71-3]
MSPQRFEMLVGLYGDERMAAILSEQELIASWMRVEGALATAQAEAGVIAVETGAAIAEAATGAVIDPVRLWRETRNVGYPILPLVRQLDEALPEEHRGRVHYGATTQDIMDSGLALQFDAAGARLGELLAGLGEAVAELATAHAGLVIAGRTHALQAVPTTFGAKMAGYLGELTRDRARLAGARRSIATVSLFGAGGTSAAYGADAVAVRRRVAELLDLRTTDISWHVARDRVAEFGAVCALLAATCARFAREVVDLSRTEIAEVSEAAGHLRGASSTMPQKANPVESEAVIGMSITAGALTSALYRVMEAGHERAAGEWQAEWQVLPQLVALAAGALATTRGIAEGLQVFPEAMRRNLDADSGLVMSEAYMIRLAPRLGRERAHDVVYAAARRCRESGERLGTVLEAMLSGQAAEETAELRPEEYVGNPHTTIDAALSQWHAPV